MTINDIREKKFDTSKRGYQPEEVDSFLQEICTQMQSMHTEKADLLKKMEILANKLEEYKKDEESIQDALLGAQKLGKKVLSEAKFAADTLTKESEEKSAQMVSMARADSEKLLNDAKAVAQDLLVKAKSESKRIIVDAQQNVDTIVRNTKYDIEKEQHNLVRIQKEVSAFKSNLLDLYRSHIDLIKNLPEVEYEAENIREAREINKSIYEQKSTTAEAEETPIVPTNGTVEFKKAELPSDEGNTNDSRDYSDNEKKIIELAKRDVLQDTVEIAKEHYVKKFNDLRFGENSNN